MMNNKGQALVEFVIIMPIFIFIALAIFDLGNIISKKYALENDLDTVSLMYENNSNDLESFVNSKNIKVKYEEYGNYNKITLSKQVKVITPLVSQALGNNYEISSSRTVMLNEDE